jgi:exopolyphosphatase/guanosine-5'-triphosphate,3'-diphosphate pyrophosphatase
VNFNKMSSDSLINITPKQEPLNSFVDRNIVASVDLGSNSFRMVIAQILETRSGLQLKPIDTLREPVKLAAGLDSDKKLDKESFVRGLDAIRRFGERLRSFPPSQVRVVATNTLRVARNAAQFIEQAQLALGFPIEVIAGREEARLIYLGAAHDAPACNDLRLVIDIGGGSTEFIIGRDYDAKMMESLYIGCVSFSKEFFPDGAIDAHFFKQAELAARQEIQVISKEFRKKGWKQVIGSSGTARAIAELIAANGLDGPAHDLAETDLGGSITRDSLIQLKTLLLKSDYIQDCKLSGLKSDRRFVLPGGLAIMIAAFDELKIESMEVVEAALRMGVIYDFLGRTNHQDMRFVTVDQFMQRYGVDLEQANRVEKLVIVFLQQFPISDGIDRKNNTALLGWAAKLHEIGLSISHNGYHKHSAYIVTYSDMPGFSKNDQDRLSLLLLGHTGKLGKLFLSRSFIDWRMLLCLRLAIILCRRRTQQEIPVIQIKETKKGYKLTLANSWIALNPLTEFSLRKESDQWTGIGKELILDYV